MKLVGVDPTWYAQHVRDVLRVGAGRARSSEGRVMQSSAGTTPVFTRKRRRGLQQWVTVGLRAPGGGRKKILGPGEVLVFLKREHRGDETRGGQAIRTKMFNFPVLQD